MWITKSFKWAPMIAGLGLGLAIQSEVALAYHLLPLLMWLTICRNKISRKDILVFGLSMLVSVSSMIVSEIKFHFTGTSGIIYLLSGQDGITQAKNLSDYVTTLLNQSGKTFAYSIFPISVVFGGLIGFLIVIVSVVLNMSEIKTKILTWETFLISWIFAYSAALPFGGWNMKHILVGVAPAVSIFVGIFIWKYFWKYKFLTVGVFMFILLANTIMIVKENRYGQTIFPLQPDLTLQNEIGVVEYTYKESSGKPFSISSLTSPLFVNTLWSYLYNWYGLSKYGHLPGWIGHDQVGQLGDNLKFAPSNTPKHFFIIEPTYGIPELWVTYAKGDQDSISGLVSQKNFGNLVVQARTIKK